MSGHDSVRLPLFHTDMHGAGLESGYEYIHER
jgi:hypothetical protein